MSTASSESIKLAALDVGTNTVLMLVAERAPDGAVHQLGDFARITRLGRGVDSNGRLDPVSAARTLEAITDFTNQARSLGAGRILTAATSALRDAQNGSDFIAQAKSRAGVELEIISGETEAQLSYLAVKNGMAVDPASRMLIVDVGGGSTELIRSEPGRKLETVSLQIGSVRLTERIIHHDPPSPREAVDLRLAVGEALSQLGWEFKPDVMIGIAGTVTTICAIALGMETYDADIVHGYRLPRTEITNVIARLGSVPLAERLKIPGLEAGRADVIFAGAAILESIMTNFGIDEVIVSDQGVRWGLIWREFEKIFGPAAR